MKDWVTPLGMRVGRAKKPKEPVFAIRVHDMEGTMVCCCRA